MAEAPPGACDDPLMLSKGMPELEEALTLCGLTPEKSSKVIFKRSLPDITGRADGLWLEKVPLQCLDVKQDA